MENFEFVEEKEIDSHTEPEKPHPTGAWQKRVVEKLRIEVDNADLLGGDRKIGEKCMQRIAARFLGVELYFENLEKAKKFYVQTLGLVVSDEQAGHHAKFDSGAGFICLERKGAESYPSKDKAVLFFEVPDLRSAVAAVGWDKVVHSEATWAVLHDPEGHNILLLQRAI